MSMADDGIFAWRRMAQDLKCKTDLPPPDSEDVHVLAVDDNLLDRKVIERLLKITSCKVTVVDSGRRALQYLGLDEERNCGLDGLKVDLIITDYCMPGMTGYELMKKIKESSNFRQIPVVIMSSENVLARIDRCLEEGADDFIVKPVKLSDVERLLDYMTRDIGLGSESKRNSRDSYDMNLSPPSIYSSPSSSPCLSPSRRSVSAPCSPLRMDSLSTSRRLSGFR